MEGGEMGKFRGLLFGARCFALLSVIPCLSGCVSSQSVEDGLSSRYVGSDIDRFFIDNGPPAGRYPLKNGDILWTWDSGTTSVEIPTVTTGNVTASGASTGTMSGGSAYYSSVSSGGTAVLRCVVQIVGSADGTIKSVKLMKDTIGVWTTSMCHEALK
jgi:hypothetical protein